MSDVELVIKIPEETYKDIQSRDWKNGDRWYSEEWKAIHNGIPIPKGHGDIVDIETLIDMFWDGNSMEITRYDLSVIEPIIPADRSEI